MRRTLTTLLLIAVTLSVAAPAGATAAPGSVRTVTYQGHGATVTLEHLDRISATSKPFQRFVERRLTRLWQDNDPRPRCRTAATMVVKTWRSDGYALISDMGSFAPCPDGGYVQIAVRTDGGWRTPVRLGAQEPFRCRDLVSYDVPAAVVPDGTCFAGQDLVSYDDWLTTH
ncbi:hypothetical protein L2K70_18070 [Nocardioides KLBMP 9356]|uniref:Secreted protein n=1 Tax=Nocardioides potassii TaxID=2911371 RepID=A0ABS9HHD1_9ACTN|nr:hypothetical protein [Nocardioides potassii]MCF6379523.1 hypothetical protein [Nocardioides potassii]